MDVIERDETGAPTLIRTPEGVSRVSRAVRERGEWVVRSHYLIEPSPEYLASLPGPALPPLQAFGVPRLTAPGLTYVVPVVPS